MEIRLPRKLAAILYADAADYARLTGEDEEGTHRQLSACLDACTAAIRTRDGRVVHIAGDAILAEFPSVYQALTCAVAIQEDLAAREAEFPEASRVRFRIGVNLGEVIVDRDDLYGDGVNVAARLQTLARPGEICVSEPVRNAIASDLPVNFEPLGEREVKNIPKPIHAYRARLAPGTALPAASTSRACQPASPNLSIAVLPFDNLAGNPEEEYFADGLADDLITDLAKLSGLFVSARNSSFTYKGMAVDVKQIGRELGVKYVLEGSVRRAGERIRINVQLIDTSTGGHLWAERYDERMDDLLALQDRVTDRIAAALALEVDIPGHARQSGGTDNVDAHDAYLRGSALYHRETPEDFAAAIPLFERALELDPDYGHACAALALTYTNGSERGLSLVTGVPWHLLRARARRYLDDSSQHPTAASCMAVSFLSLKQRLWTDAVNRAGEAVALEPSNANAYGMLSYALMYCGQPERAIEAAYQALRLDPLNPGQPLQWIGRAHFTLGNFEESLRWLDRARRHNPTVRPAALVYASASAHLGRRSQARSALAQYVETWNHPPTVRQIMYFWPYQDPSVAIQFVEGIIAAGIDDPSGAFYQITDSDRLDTRAIASLVEGRRASGLGPWDGRQWCRAYGDDTVDWQGPPAGEPTWHGPDVAYDTGRFAIRDDLLCERWETMNEGTAMRFPVFRNPSGRDGCMDDYLFITDTGIYACSLEE